MLEDDRLFEPGRFILLAKLEEREAEIESFHRQHGRCIVKFRGIDAISDAEKYVGAEIRIPASELAPPKEGWFYTFQLKGCSVFTVDGEYIGAVTGVLDSGGTEILKVDRDQEETLIPFATTYMKRIDVGQRRIEVDLPEELRELNR